MRNSKSLLFVWVLTLFLGYSAIAQNTMKFDEAVGSPEANLDDIGWIAGHWQGEAFGGITEEIWSAPLGNSMMGAFKLIAENKVQFYELVTITEINNTILLQLKHFHGNLKGWEEKDETVDFRLVKVSPSKVYFDEFTFELIDENTLDVYVVIGSKDGTASETLFRYFRVQ